MEKNDLVIIMISLIISTSVLGYFSYQQHLTINNLNERSLKTEMDLRKSLDKIKDANLRLSDKDDEISQLIDRVSSLLGERSKLQKQVSNLVKEKLDLTKGVREKSKELEISKSELEELSSATKKQNERIQALIEKQQSEGKYQKVISEEYQLTLAIYDSEETYSFFHPLFIEVMQDGTNYSRLAIPFFYFRDEKGEEGDLYGLNYFGYDYILIFIGGDKYTIYHEIAHAIYKELFLKNSENFDIWISNYNYWKENNLLSTDYAYTDDNEGLAEEYATYKIGLRQEKSIKEFMAEVEALSRS